MSHLVSGAKVHRLLINGQDYTSQMVSWVVSDSSAYKNGLIVTQGQMIIAGVQGGPYMTDYDRNNFRRGQKVILEVKTPTGGVVRHPRGLLYIFSDSYDVESESLIVEIGCRIALASLTQEIDNLLALAPLELDAVRRDLGAISGSFASNAELLYQDRNGDLVSRKFFGTDSTEAVAPGEWVSVLGQTSSSVKPLAGTKAIPDLVNLSYSSKAEAFNNDDSKIDISTTESFYFLTYPATYYRRTGEGLEQISGITVTAPSTGQSSGCGNTPPAPNPGQPAGCNDGYELHQQPLILPAQKTVTQRTEYNGPAGQVSRVYSETRGHALEANPQYFADSYAYCRYTWATACSPNGECSTEDGMEQVLLSYTEVNNFYGDAGELVRTVTDTYATTLSGAQPFDWRSGNINGVPQDFQTMDASTMYRVTRVIAEIFQEGDSSVQETTSWTSVTRDGAGLVSGNIDALDGVVNFERRRSVTISVNPTSPDSVNSPETVTKTSSTPIVLYTGAYLDNPEEAGPYVAQEQIPVPILEDDPDASEEIVQNYADYLGRFIRGDAFGLQIAEYVREEMMTLWEPGMPFRYWDASKDKLMAMRMDACSWGADSDGVSVAFNGIWIGFSDGQVIGGDNLVGNSVPDGDGGSSAAPADTGRFRVIDETFVDQGSYAWQVDVFFNFTGEVNTYGNDGVIPPQPDGPITLREQHTFTCWVNGIVLKPGGLYSPGQNGGLPSSTGGVLITADAEVVIADVFDGQTSSDLIPAPVDTSNQQTGGGY